MIVEDAMSARYIRWIGDAELAQVALVGGKGRSLQKMAGAGLPVPDAFVVTTTAYREALSRSLTAEIRRRVAAVGRNSDLVDVEAAASSIRDLLHAETEGNVADLAVRDAYAVLGERLDGNSPPVAVRSSSAAEDSTTHSFAGGHDSYLWVSGADEVSDAVRRCWASLYTARAISYRMRTGSSASEDAMAVVVQQMVDARAAGVFMTLNPVNGDRSKIVVESVWGLGETLVSGAVTPDRFVVDRVTGEVLESVVARKDLRASRDVIRGQGVTLVEVGADDVERPSLSTRELAELVGIARRVESLNRCPQDGEFAVAGSNHYLLQARPETVWSATVPTRVSNGANALSQVLSVLTNGFKSSG